MNEHKNASMWDWRSFRWFSYSRWTNCSIADILCNTIWYRTTCSLVLVHVRPWDHSDFTDFFSPLFMKWEKGVFFQVMFSWEPYNNTILHQVQKAAPGLSILRTTAGNWWMKRASTPITEGEQLETGEGRKTGRNPIDWRGTAVNWRGRAYINLIDWRKLSSRKQYQG